MKENFKRIFPEHDFLVDGPELEKMWEAAVPKLMETCDKTPIITGKAEEFKEKIDLGLKKILEQFETLKGQFVLFITGEPERLVAIGSDEWDYYWISYNGRRLKWHTCVGRVIPLKGYLREEDYSEIVRIASINHFDQPKLWDPSDEEKMDKTKKFNEQHKKEVVILGEGDNLLTEICWNLS